MTPYLSVSVSPNTTSFSKIYEAMIKFMRKQYHTVCRYNKYDKGTWLSTYVTNTI